MKLQILFATVLVALTMSFSADRAEAQSYSGGWYYFEQGGGYVEELWLGDGDHYCLDMRGTSRFCAQPGAA